MKAYVVPKTGPLETIHWIEIDQPKPGPKDILIQVKGSALNPADIKVATGRDGGRFLHSLRPPVRLGFDFSGEVVDMGPQVSFWKKGDEVYGHLPYSSSTVQGSFAEFLSIPEDQAGRKPGKVDHPTTAALATTASTAYQTLVDICGIRAGQQVLINGASGGVGCFASQITHDFGCEVWGTAGKANLDFISGMGVDHPIDYGERSVTEMSHKYDVVFDAAAKLSFGTCATILKEGGIYVTLLPSISYVMGLLISFFSSKKNKICIVKSKKQTLTALSDLIDSGRISVPIDRTYPLSDISGALNYFSANSVQGKIAITMD